MHTPLATQHRWYVAVLMSREAGFRRSVAIAARARADCGAWDDSSRKRHAWVRSLRACDPPTTGVRWNVQPSVL
jgi:hypothetical protein